MRVKIQSSEDGNNQVPYVLYRVLQSTYYKIIRHVVFYVSFSFTRAETVDNFALQAVKIPHGGARHI